MELTEKWFYIDETKTDLENVISFIEMLPANLNQIINSEKSNFQKQFIEADSEFGITWILFNSAFKEAQSELDNNLKPFIRDFKIDEIIGAGLKKRKAGETLLSIGFSNDSLKLKSLILNKLWKKILNKVNELGSGIIDFANNEVVKLVRHFLEYLNSILGSLKELIPGIDGIKEFKEIIESYLAIADK